MRSARPWWRWRSRRSRCVAARQPAFAAEAAADRLRRLRNARPRRSQDLPPVSPQRAVRIADRTPEVREQRRRHPDLSAARHHPLHGQRQLGHQVPGRVQRDEARRRHGRRPHRRGRRGLAGDPGRLGDGPRRRRLLRRDGSRAGTSGSRSARCSCSRSSTPAGRSGSCTSTCWCWSAASASRTSSSTEGEIGTSVPLVYPVLAYFLGRMLVAAFRPRRSTGPLVPIVPAAFLVAGIVLLGGLRIGLDLTSGRVGDVGYGSAVGAYRIQHDEPLYVDSGEERPALRHLRAGQLPGLRPVRTGAGAHRAAAPGVRELRPAGRPRGRARVRRADDHRAVPARPAAEVAAAPGACSAWRLHTAG